MNDVVGGDIYYYTYDESSVEISDATINYFVVPETHHSITFVSCVIPDFNNIILHDKVRFIEFMDIDHVINLPDQLNIYTLCLLRCSGVQHIPEGIKTLSVYYTKVKNVPSTVTLLICDFTFYFEHRHELTYVPNIKVEIMVTSLMAKETPFSIKLASNVKEVKINRGMILDRLKYQAIEDIELFFCKDTEYVKSLYNNDPRLSPEIIYAKRDNFAARMIQRMFRHWHRKRVRAANFLQRWWHAVSFNRQRAAFSVLGEAFS